MLSTQNQRGKLPQPPWRCLLLYYTLQRFGEILASPFSLSVRKYKVSLFLPRLTLGQNDTEGCCFSVCYYITRCNSMLVPPSPHPSHICTSSQEGPYLQTHVMLGLWVQTAEVFLIIIIVMVVVIISSSLNGIRCSDDSRLRL